MKLSSIVLTLLLAQGCATYQGQPMDFSAAQAWLGQPNSASQPQQQTFYETPTQQAARNAAAANYGVSPDRCKSIWSFAEQRYIATCQ